MAQVDFKKALIIDDRINVSKVPVIGVQRGGTEVTSQRYTASNISPSVVSWSINPPSLNTLVSRSARLNTRCTFRVSRSGANQIANNAFLLSFGNNFGVNQGGFQRLISTANLQINNTSVNFSYEDLYNSMLRLFSEEELAKYLGESASMPDTFQSYANLGAGVNNPISGYNNSTGFSKFQPRGSYPIVSASVNPLVAGDGAGAGTQTVDITIDFSENLCMSPFVFGEASSTAEAMFGINNFQLTFNLSSTLPQKMFAYAIGSTANGITATTHDLSVSLLSVDRAELELVYITMPPTMPLPIKSEVPYFDIPRYITSYNANFAAGAVLELPSTTVTLPVIPEKLLIFAKPKTIANTRADWRTPIEKISINWGNKSNLMSNFSQNELYELSVRNGLKMSYNDFRGFAKVSQVGGALLANTSLVGGMIVIDTARDLGLDLSQSPNEVAQLSLQITATLRNTTGDNVGDLQLFIVPIVQGLLVTEAGQSSVFLSLLSRTDVIEALDGKAELMSESDVKRMVGSGSFWQGFKGVMNKALPIVKNIAKSIPPGSPYSGPAQAISGTLETLGYGYTGGRKSRLY